MRVFKTVLCLGVVALALSQRASGRMGGSNSGCFFPFGGDLSPLGPPIP